MTEHIDSRDRAFGPSRCPDCGEEHGTNAPECAECLNEAMAQKENADVLGLFCCPSCGWAATTGAGWERCPHCAGTSPPAYREYVPRPTVSERIAERADLVPLVEDEREARRTFKSLLAREHHRVCPWELS